MNSEVKDLKLMKLENRLEALISKGETKNQRLINKAKRKRRAYLKAMEVPKQ